MARSIYLQLSSVQAFLLEVLIACFIASPVEVETSLAPGGNTWGFFFGVGEGVGGSHAAGCGRN